MQKLLCEFCFPVSPEWKSSLLLKKKIRTSDQTQFWEDLRQVSKRREKCFSMPSPLTKNKKEKLLIEKERLNLQTCWSGKLEKKQFEVFEKLRFHLGFDYNLFWDGAKSRGINGIERYWTLIIRVSILFPLF